MIEKIKISKTIDEELLLSFVTRAAPVSADNILVEFASFKMIKRLREQRDKGYKGWNTAQCENADLKRRLLQNVEEEDWVDVINFASMLLARKQLFDEVSF